jgi:membrane-bound lytic murein transglycosylase D
LIVNSVSTLAVTVLLLTASAFAQGVSTGSSLRATPNQIERDDPAVTQIITRAENHFRQAKLNLEDNRREQARNEFDRAVDVILESGMDVRANPRLRDYYLQLVERIYREEVPSPGARPNTTTEVAVVQTGATTANGETETQQVATNHQTTQQQPQIGFREQHFEPSPLDELSRLVLTETERTVTPADEETLRQAASTINFAFNQNALIQQYINYYRGRGRSTMEAGLRRSGRYITMARRIFREEGVPEDIAWLGQVESAWRPRAFSSAAASGLWQFIPSTGARFGLRQTAWVDERNSFEQATRASARYLRWLASRYNGNWELAMGAYNTGEGNIDRAIARAGSRDFWRIYPYIAQETRNYVPNILATILIANNPERYGFRVTQRDTPIERLYDTVRVPSATSLQFVAEATGTSLDYIRSLNPELRRDITPRGESYNLRVPAGRSRQFIALLNRVPAGRREAVRVVRGSEGENLEAFSRRTGISLAQLRELNSPDATGSFVVPPSATRHTLRIQEAPRVTTTTTNSPTTRSLVRVRANAGDTIASIAARHGASADEVARLNGIPSGAPLQRGQQIIVPSRGTRR